MSGSEQQRILFFGDIVGRAGRRFLAAEGPRLRLLHGAACVIVNGENSAAGNGISRSTAGDIRAAGADVITLGDHTFGQKEAKALLAETSWIVRPANYPQGTPGQEISIIPLAGTAFRLAVVNLMGRVFMQPLVECPFRTFDRLYAAYQAPDLLWFVDFHGEATSEKAAFAHYVAGRAIAVVGTHTHVQTADEKIINLGTAFISDVGMGGPEQSVIGMDIAVAQQRFLTAIAERYEEGEGRAVLCAVAIDVDLHKKQAVAIHRLRLVESEV